MAMGPRKPSQLPMFVTQDQLPQAPSSPFLDVLNQILADEDFDLRGARSTSAAGS